MVIIVADLIDIEVKALSVLQRFKRDIGWSIVDIVGIPPGISTHKIQLELNFIPSIKHQHQLNTLIQEVVNKEIIKWLDAGVVYPILITSGSVW